MSHENKHDSKQFVRADTRDFTCFFWKVWGPHWKHVMQFEACLNEAIMKKHISLGKERRLVIYQEGFFIKADETRMCLTINV